MNGVTQLRGRNFYINIRHYSDNKQTPIKAAQSIKLKTEKGSGNTKTLIG